MKIDRVAPEIPVRVTVDGEAVDAFIQLGTEARYTAWAWDLYEHVPRAFLDLVRDGLGVVKQRQRTGTAPPRFRSQKDVDLDVENATRRAWADGPPGPVFRFTIRREHHGT